MMHVALFDAGRAPSVPRRGGTPRAPGAWHSVPVLVVSLIAAACGGSRSTVPPNTAAPDQFLYQRGHESLKNEQWLNAREYFRQVVDGYPQSPVRPDSKLGVGDSFLGEDSAESLVLAAQEFREFLQFYPTNPRADYAQYKLGMTYFKQMRGPQRDQTETREAVRELQTFVERYPNSQLRPEAEAKLREARDRVSTSEYQIGVFYYKQRWYPGAIDRLRALMKSDPGFTYRDGLYYYLAESLVKVRLDAEALPLYDKLLAEFTESEFLEKAKLRQAELKENMAKAGAPATPPTSDTATPPPATAPDQKPQPPQAGVAVQPKP
jgi:outer membrane protein assembly factor BamD